MILSLIKKKMKNINKKYIKILDLVDHANGRKEFVNLLKKATYLKAQIEDIKAS